MRVRRHTGSSPMPMDGSHSFMLSRVLVYMDRLLEKHPSLDFEILEALHWLLGPESVEEDLIPLVTMLDAGDRRPRFDADLRDEIRHARDFANLMDQALRKTRKDEQMCVVGLLRGLIQKKLSKLESRCTSDIEKNVRLFQEMFDLTQLETEICLFLFILTTYDEAQTVFEYHLKCDRYAGRNNLATILGSKVPTIAEATNGKLLRIGILDIDRGRSLCMDNGFVNLLQNASDTEIKTEFFRKIDPDPVPIDAHTVDPEVIDHILNLLRAKPLSSTQIIFYGPPGTGKTSLAYGIGKKLGLPIYLVEHGGKESGWRRRAAFTASVNMASQSENALVIADDSDGVLGTRQSWFFSGETSDKRWLHDVLEVPGVRMIWTVNSISSLEESVSRRFAYSLCFKPFTRVQRKRIWETILADYRLDSFLDSSDIDDLARRFEVSPGVIEQSIKKAAEIGSNDRAEIHKAIVFALEAHQCLVNGGHKPLRAGKIDPESFTLDGLNVSGANLSSLMKELESFNDYLKHSGTDEPISMSLLFHGVSGAGKSYLASIIAHRLDRELIIKRASDLLSPWVGGTEHNVRSAFDECAEKEAILLVDEADFLLGNRDGAVRSWEVSQVNEVLTAMELFRGVQIYTSNRFADLDPATLRRFNHKIEFHCLDSEGVVVFYKKILQPLVGSDLEKKLEKELMNISDLTPGDFKVVMTQFRFKSIGERSHKAMIAALRGEAQVKEVHAGQKAIGF